MPRFSKTSKKRLHTCHPDLQEICQRVIGTYDFTVLEGHRGEERQNRLHEEGKSTLQYPDSKHNGSPSQAVDIAPYPIDWDDRLRFGVLAGHMFQAAHELREEGMITSRLRWGGDWDEDRFMSDNTFDDLVHFELT